MRRAHSGVSLAAVADLAEERAGDSAWRETLRMFFSLPASALRPQARCLLLLPPSRSSARVCVSCTRMHVCPRCQGDSVDSMPAGVGLGVLP